ncbi:MAG: hypothetical protein AAF393_15275 [Pseudomonadota bacterium]
MKLKNTARALLISLVAGTPAMAGAPVVEKATANCSGQTCSFSVTISHGDTGWDHYADGWGVYTTDGKELGYRVLHHPHVDEQPFTRSLSGVKIPDGVKTVVIIPRDSVHKLGEGVKVSIP